MEVKRKREIIKLSSKGQLTLPKRFRKELKIDKGDYLVVYEIGEKMLLLEKMQLSSLEKITEDISKAVKMKKFTSDDLIKAIKEVRRELWDEIYKENN